METMTDSRPRVPSFVDLFNPLTRRMLGAGLPMGPNALITIRGRKSGEPRTTPIALIEIEGRRWVSIPFGDVNWVRNLRAPGDAALTIGRKHQSLPPIPLSHNKPLFFFRDLLVPFNL